MPCRGTGKVISNLGGERREVRCPWCQGTGVRQSDVNAQSAWVQAEGARASGAADETSRQAG
jgi:DnaJ-class molecular chaperone